MICSFCFKNFAKTWATMTTTTMGKDPIQAKAIRQKTVEPKNHRPVKNAKSADDVQFLSKNVNVDLLPLKENLQV
jgi:hypothetical protein